MKKLLKRIMCLGLVTIMIFSLSLIVHGNDKEPKLQRMPADIEKVNFQEELEKNLDEVELIVIGDYELDKINISSTCEDVKAKSEQMQTDDKNNFQTHNIAVNDENEINKEDIKETVEFKNVQYTDKMKNINLKEKSSKKDMKTILISQKDISKWLDSENLTLVKDALKKGYLVFFLNDKIDEINTITERLHDGLNPMYLQDTSDDKTNEISTTRTYEVLDENNEIVKVTENLETIATYYSVNSIGEFTQGSLHVPEDYTKEETDSYLIYNAWCYRNSYFYTSDDNAINEANANDKELIAGAGPVQDLDVGNAWHFLGSYRKSYISRNKTYGDADIHFSSSQTAEKNFYYLKEKNANVKGEYFAATVRVSTTPNHCQRHSNCYVSVFMTSVNFTDYCEVSSNAKVGNMNNRVYEYEPKRMPKSTTTGFSIGTGLGKKGVSGNIGFSYTIGGSELSVVDHSIEANELVKVRYTFPLQALIIPSNYSVMTTVQYFTIIHKTNEKQIYFQINAESNFKQYSPALNFIWGTTIPGAGIFNHYFNETIKDNMSYMMNHETTCAMAGY